MTAMSDLDASIWLKNLCAISARESWKENERYPERDGTRSSTDGVSKAKKDEWSASTDPRSRVEWLGSISRGRTKTYQKATGILHVFVLDMNSSTITQSLSDCRVLALEKTGLGVFLKQAHGKVTSLIASYSSIQPLLWSVSGVHI